ncbi:MAG TPA: hypothetical protein IAA74_09535 [Candidatus Excrementavichristensenella intestinipullorum]|nr:hypothetical protein [Candidatus Excrementavichristensenella intestinipullorum]
MAKKKSVPNRQQAHVKHENKFITMPKEKFIKICVIVGVVILAVVLFFVLRRAYDGHLPVEDGVVVTQGDNWLVVNTESPNARYFRLGELGEVDGYTLESSAYSSDANLLSYTYTPTDEASSLDNISVASLAASYTQYAQSFHNNLLLYYGDLTVSDLEDLEANGVAAQGFSYEYIPAVEETATEETATEETATEETATEETAAEETATEETAAEETAAGETAAAGEETAAGETAAGETALCQRVYALCLKAGHDSCIIVEASSQADTEEGLASAEALKEEALKVAGAMTID